MTKITQVDSCLVKQ